MSLSYLWEKAARPRPLVRLKDHVDLINGFPFDASGFNPSIGTPVIRIRDLLTGGTETYFDGHVPPEVIVHKGDLLIGMDGDFNAVTWTGPQAALNQRLCLVRARSSMDQRYLAYVAPILLKAINDVTFSTTVKHLSSLDLLAERIPLPPLALQRAIADYLDRETGRIDALIDKKQRLKELLQERRQTLITEAISRSHDPGTAARSDAVTTRRLKHLASIAVSNVDKKTVSDERSVRLCNYTDVYYNERITAELPFMEATASADQIESFGLRADDVLLTKDSETPDDIAVPAYVVADLPDVVCGYHLALLRPSQEVDGRYLFWALASRSSREQFSASANGITRFGLRYDSFGEVLVPLPPIATQRAIADYLDGETARIDALIQRIESQTSLLQEHRQALITAAVTGEVEVPGVAA